MDFSINDVITEEEKQQLLEDANQVDYVGGNYITEPCYGVFKIESIELKIFKGSPETPTQTQALDFVFNGELGKAKSTVWVSNKQGQNTYKCRKTGKERYLPGFSLIRTGLLKCLGISEMKMVKMIVDSEEKMMYPSMVDKEIGVMFNIRLTDGKNGKYYKNPEIVTFYNPETGQTGSEILAGSEPKKKDLIAENLTIVDERKLIYNDSPKKESNNNDEDDFFAKD